MKLTTMKWCLKQCSMYTANRSRSRALDLQLQVGAELLQQNQRHEQVNTELYKRSIVRQLRKLKSIFSRNLAHSIVFW
ncbi:hypothetical protein Cob_v002465 [Colletotrichum orbiculare MAFF 240422]|uniref:Uncharacterized protein n=1 Tax=Colletotrichum orbiculare (strain 104-T / ATCC 96160 / CBS 514.97 / LARS 414 / MAFF 240422) TaxID=1213857 RepID=A0A484G5N5_COLOR|nr:hypothetical protein Cob_v002465 [Colletotrichum orbiculare MAFF 240422]